jgi:hypothetical protein
VGVIINPSFETPAVDTGVDYERVPASWTISSSGALWESAVFGPPLRWAETFSALWSGNEDEISEFTAPDLERGTIGTALGADSFETEWANDGDYPEFTVYLLDRGLFGASAILEDSYEVEWYSRHANEDVGREVDETYFLPADTAEIMACLNDEKAQHNLHRTAAGVHSTDDTVNVVSSPNASDLATAETLADELWDMVWLHVTDGALAFHRAYETASEMGKQDDANFHPASGWSDCWAVAAYLAILLNRHFSWSSAAGPAGRPYYLQSGTVFSDVLDLVGMDTPESYESGWNLNENAISVFAPGDIDAGEFEDYVGTAAYYESFESSGWPLGVSSTPGQYGAEAPCDPTEFFRVLFTGSLAVGTDLRVQVRRPRSPTYTEVAAVTAITGGALDVDAGPGFEDVRIYTQTWGGAGSFTVERKWRRISTL